jgi:hypothetical protein
LGDALALPATTFLRDQLLRASQDFVIVDIGGVSVDNASQMGNEVDIPAEL